MSLYHHAPYTVTADQEIPVEAAPAAGYTEEMADQLQTGSQDYLTEELTLEVITEGLYAHATVGFANHDWPDDYRVYLTWGDGVGEYASELSEGHPYSYPGSYQVTAIVERDGEPSLSRSVMVDVPAVPEAVPI